MASLNDFSFVLVYLLGSEELDISRFSIISSDSKSPILLISLWLRFAVSNFDADSSGVFEADTKF